MNDLKIFKNETFGEIRTVTIDNEPWFVLKDVARALSIDNHKDLHRRLDDDEVGRFGLPHPQSAGKVVEMTCVNESGLYNVILRSDKPEAKPFRKWVTSEVLPSIRKHGAYMTQETLEAAILNPDYMLKVVSALKEEHDKRMALEAKVEQDAPKVLFAQAVESSKTSILVGDLAKLLRQNGVEIGQKRLFDWLRTNGYLIKGGSSKNMPTQKSMDMGLFEVKESTVVAPDGSVRVTKTPKVTGKGQTYFVNKLLTA